MNVTRTAAKIHKWLTVIVGLPILAWFVSGLFIAFVPEEAIHGHAATLPAAEIDPAAIARPLADILAAQKHPVAKIEIRSMLGRPVALLSTAEGRPSLIDIFAGRAISPVDRATAIALARAEMGSEAGAPTAIVPIEKPLRAYPGPLPAWRVDFADKGATQVYVAADLGRVMVRRNSLFRIYDIMWSLHILNFVDPRGINTLWLWAAAALAVLVAASGFVMLPNRLGLFRRRRSKPAA